jgi:hypothetical protein
VADQPRISEAWRDRSQWAGEMRPGEEAFLAPEAMKVDIHLCGWIDPQAERFALPMKRQGPHNRVGVGAFSAARRLLAVERTAAGFRVDLRHLAPRRWPTEPIPDPERSGGFPWYPVVEFIDES